jgi:spore coat polysaccharide biosynthesis protein SpsF
MKTGIITQARMTSTRLPGKVLKTVLGKTLLEHHIERLRRAKVDEVVVATTTNAEDEPVVALCRKLSVPYFRGSELDVLGRYAGAAKQRGLDLVVRVTSDCPLIDPLVIDRVIALRSDKYDYASNTITRSYPRGMDTEVFSGEMLAQAAAEAKEGYEREHVTPFFYKRPERFRIGQDVYPTDESAHRWTVDTPEDFLLIEKLLTGLYPEKPDFSLEDALALIGRHPGWSRLNAGVEQKPVL